MEQPVNFARQFSHLVWLLLHEPASIDEQKMTLRSLVTLSKTGAAHLALHPDGLQIDDEPVSNAFTGVSDVRTQMGLHGLALIIFDENVLPADLLNVARVLAGMPVKGDGGVAADAQRRAYDITTIRFAARPRISTEALPQRSSGEAPVESSGDTSSIPDMDFGEVYDDPYAEAMARATPRSSQSVNITPAKSRAGDGFFGQFAARVPTESYTELLHKLDATEDIGEVAEFLEDLCLLAEAAATEGKSHVVSEIMYRIGRRENDMTEFEAKRAFIMSLRRLAKPPILRTVAEQLTLDQMSSTELIGVLVRAGEEGADALIELLSDDAHQRHRRVFFNVLMQLKAGVPTLLHMLSDSRWFAARNAAELLGEMQVREAEGPLTDLLRHEDERVRRTASGALMRLGTTRSMDAIQHALAESNPQARADAATALGTRRDAPSVNLLVKALDAEKDADVQTAMLLALGKMATQDAVERLVKAATGERGLFRRRTTAFRVAAVHGLTEAKTVESVAALRDLQSDKDDDVRGAALFGLRRASRPSSVMDLPAL